MLKSEYDAYGVLLLQYNALVARRTQLQAMKDILDNNTNISFVDVRYGAGGANEVSVSGSSLAGIRTDLIASVADEITAVNNLITSKLAAMLAEDATTSGPDPAFT
jgi:hypothetical protein